MKEDNLLQLKKQFVHLLESTGREGVSEVLEKLEETDFYNAPASSRFHLACPGGLLAHSLHVFEVACQLRDIVSVRRPELMKQLPIDSVVIATLLHDICKAGIYKEALVSVKDAEGRWEKRPGYQLDYKDYPLGHGEKSVILLLSWGLKLTEDEMLAIRWHMTAWDLAFQSPEQRENLSIARAKTPLCSLVQAADSVSTGLLER